MARLTRPPTEPFAALECQLCEEQYYTTPGTANECPECGGEEWVVCGRDHDPKSDRNTIGGSL